MWSKEAHCTSIFYKCINQRERNKLFSTKSRWPTYYMDIFYILSDKAFWNHRNIACLRVCSQVKVHTPVSGSSTVHELLNSWIWSQFKKKISVVQRANIRPTLLLNYRWWSNKGDARLLYWKQILSGRYPREIRPLWSLYFLEQATKEASEENSEVNVAITGYQNYQIAEQ